MPTIDANPFAYEFDIDHIAVVCIDMQRDFCCPLVSSWGGPAPKASWFSEKGCVVPKQALDSGSREKMRDFGRPVPRYIGERQGNPVCLFLITFLDDPVSGADDTGRKGGQGTPPSAAATEGSPGAMAYQPEGVQPCQPKPRGR
jgi:hypothetical protein